MATAEDWFEHGELCALVLQARTGYVVDRSVARAKRDEPRLRRERAFEAAAREMPAVSGPGLGINVRRRDVRPVIAAFEEVSTRVQ